MNFKGDVEGLEVFREEDMPFLRFTEQIVDDQHRRGDHGMAENPATSEAWNREPLMRLRRKFWETTTNMCMFNLHGHRGGLLYKTGRWVATHPRLIEAVQRKCDGTHEHEPVLSGNAKASGAYTVELADAILAALVDIIAEEDFGSSCLQRVPPREVHYVKPVDEEAAWKPVLDGATELLSRTSSSARFLSEGSELYQLVQKLLPWRLLNVQTAYLPKAKRARSELGSDLHRCTAISYTDGTFTVESEYLPESQAPRERFVKPVRLAVFVLGKAPTDDTQSSEADAQPARARPSSSDVFDQSVDDETGDTARRREDFARGEIWFSGPSLRPEEKR